MLQHLATSAPARSTAGALDRSGEQDPLRIVQMSLEVDQSGPLVNRAIDRVMAEGRSAAILKLFASPPAGNSATGAMMARLASPATFAALAAREPLDSDALDQLFPNITLEGYAALLDALAASPNRSTRRKLLDRLGRTGLDVGPLIAARLDDQRWYVVRNMLVLLQRVGRLPPGFSPAPWTRYPDPRVRLEALQLQLMVPAERAEAMQDALEDPDSRVLRLGLTAATQGCPPSIARTVAAIAQDPKAAEDARILAVRALGRSSDVLACNTLIQLVDGGRTLLGRPRLAAPTPICVAAIRALAEGWGHEPAVAPVLTLAAASPDPQLRRAAASGGA
jgi:hypothetical protein